MGCFKIPLPFTDMVGSGRHKNSYFEWVKDKLRDPNTANAEIDGADAANFVAETGERVGNHSQISQSASPRRTALTLPTPSDTQSNLRMS